MFWWSPFVMDKSACFTLLLFFLFCLGQERDISWVLTVKVWWGPRRKAQVSVNTGPHKRMQSLDMFYSHPGLHWASVSLSKLLCIYSYQFMTLSGFCWADLGWTCIFLDMHVCLDWGGNLPCNLSFLMDPQSHWFSISETFSCCKDGSNISKLFTVGAKPKISLFISFSFLSFFLKILHLIPHLRPLLTTGDYKVDLFFYEFVCFWSIIDLQHYASSWCTT